MSARAGSPGSAGPYSRKMATFAPRRGAPRWRRMRVMITASAPPTRCSRPTAAENLDPAECVVLLATQRLGRLAVAAEAGQGPHLVPVNYALVRGSIIVRSVPGTKLDRILSQAVTFEVDNFDPFRRTGWSVVVEGLASEVPDREMEDEA